MLEYGSKAISVITIASGNLSLISLIDLGTMPLTKEERRRQEKIRRKAMRCDEKKRKQI